MESNTDDPTARRRKRTIRSLLAIAIVALIGLMGLVRADLALSVTFLEARVLDVQTIPGRDLSHRIALVDFGDHTRVLRTGDRLLALTPNSSVCVKQTTLLIRRWVRNSLALPGYCSDLRRPASPARSVSASLAFRPLATTDDRP